MARTTGLVPVCVVLVGAVAAHPFHRPTPSQARPIGITHVTVIDVEHGTRLRNHTVIIEGRYIATVGSSAQVRVPDGYGVVDARGKFLIPGLIDTRAHSMPPVTGRSAPDSLRWLARLALSGATTVVVDDSARFGALAAHNTTPLPMPRIRAVPAAASHDTTTVGDIHELLKRSVAAGLTPAAALRAVTFDAAVALGWKQRIGRVAPGQLADLLLLDANPLDDIGNSPTVAAMVIDGRFIDGAERNRLVAQLPPGRE